MDMSEKTVLVTGATSGIGFVAASQLAAMGARVILVGRNERKGDSAIKNILNSTPQAILRYFSADLSCQQDIIILAKEEHGLRWLKSIRLNLATVAPMVFLVTGF